jgi:hypothetical protein
VLFINLSWNHNLIWKFYTNIQIRILYQEHFPEQQPGKVKLSVCVTN